MVAAVSAGVFRAPLLTLGGLIFATEGGKIVALNGPTNAYQAGSYSPTIVTWPEDFDAQPPISEGSPVVAKVYRGWPESGALDVDLINGKANISVFPEPGMTRITTRYQDTTRVPLVTPTTLLASAAGQIVSFTGNCNTPHLAGVAIGNGPAWATYTYATLPGDRPQDVAAALAAMIPGASSAGGFLVTPSFPVVSVIARTGALQVGSLETRRQTQSFRISVWCPTPLVRDALASAVDVRLSQIRWLTLLDGTNARFLMQSVFVDDKPSKDRVWRRDFRVMVEYPTTVSTYLPIAIFIDLTLAPLGVAAGAVTITA